MRTRKTQARKFVVLFVLIVVEIAALLYGYEYYLRTTDPFPKLPFDTNYYNSNRIYYSYLKVPQDGVYTWGHPVVNNRFGFRERDFTVPKPAGVCRIMVLGDSFTWGTGLALEERYTNLVESHLNHTFPDRKFEVLNFALEGLPTVTERRILRDFKDLVNPDLVVIGFSVNDTQPRGQDYTVEKEQFEKKYGHLLDALSLGLAKVGLAQTARTTRRAIGTFTVKAGIVPPWAVGLQRTYEESSTEWVEFEQALRDVKTMSDEMDLPPPIFAVLNEGIYLDHPTDYEDEDRDETLPAPLRWSHQAERAAAEAGFRTLNYEKELIERLTPEKFRINELDYHPPAEVSLAYARKLFDVIAADVVSGDLCDPASLQGAESPGTAG